MLCVWVVYLCPHFSHFLYSIVLKFILSKYPSHNQKYSSKFYFYEFKSCLYVLESSDAFKIITSGSSSATGHYPINPSSRIRLLYSQDIHNHLSLFAPQHGTTSFVVWQDSHFCWAMVRSSLYVIHNCIYKYVINTV